MKFATLILSAFVTLTVCAAPQTAKQYTIEENDKRDIELVGQGVNGRVQFFHSLHRMAFYAVFDNAELRGGKFLSGKLELVMRNVGTGKTYTLTYPFEPNGTKGVTGNLPEGFNGGSSKRPEDYYFYGNLPDDVPQKWTITARFVYKTGDTERTASFRESTIELNCIAGNVSAKMERNLAHWKRQAQNGNPLERQIYDTSVARNKKFSPAMDKLHPWGYPGKASKTFKAAYAATTPGSPYYKNPQTLRYALDGIEFLISELDEHGCWWYPKRRNWKSNDPNTNRFTLYPLLDAVWCLSHFPEYKDKIESWKAPLRKAADFQLAVYRYGLACNESGKTLDTAEFGLDPSFSGEKWGGRYLNQDVMILLSETFIGKIFNDPARLKNAHKILEIVGSQVIPGGGFHYIYTTNESPGYNALNLCAIARYATVTGDKLAGKILGQTENYWLNVMTQEGTAECWSDVWWKQSWSETTLPGLVVAAAFAPKRQAELDYLVSSIMKRNPPCRDYDHIYLYAAPYWRGFKEGTKQPEQMLFYDSGAKAWRGRNGNWYYGLGGGRQMRNHFSGAVLSNPDSIGGFDSAMDGSNIRILTKNKRDELFLANSEWDRTQSEMKELPGRGAIMKLRYTPQAHRDTVNMPKEDTPWQVSQLLLADKSGMYGLITAEAVRDTEYVDKIIGEISLVRHYLKQTGKDTFRIGSLNIRIFDTFAAPKTGKGGWNGKEAVVMELPVNGTVKKGTRYTFSYRVGPGESPELKSAPDKNSFRVILPDGKTIDVK